MSLFYQLVFGLLCAEIVATLVILTPMPLGWRKALFKFISTSSLLGQLRYFINILLVFVAVLFLGTYF